MVIPGPTKVSDFAHLPDSIKSDLEGDTIQIPNVSAYFSNNFRDYSTNFYRKEYKSNTWLPILPLRLNHPPEFAFTAIKKHTDSTYLEEFVYPLRDSLYVNGLEPFYENGDPRYPGATQFDAGGKSLYTKVTLRYYPSALWVKLLVWVGIMSSIYLLWHTGKRVLYEDRS